MKYYPVVFSPEARRDLFDLYDYISVHAGAKPAMAYIQNIEAYCRTLSAAPHRGTKHDNLRIGLRTVTFRKRLTLAFHIDPDKVVIDRMLYGGRDFSRHLK